MNIQVYIYIYIPFLHVLSCKGKSNTQTNFPGGSPWTMHLQNRVMSSTFLRFCESRKAPHLCWSFKGKGRSEQRKERWKENNKESVKKENKGRNKRRQKGHNRPKKERKEQRGKNHNNGRKTHMLQFSQSIATPIARSSSPSSLMSSTNEHTLEL